MPFTSYGPPRPGARLRAVAPPMPCPAPVTRARSFLKVDFHGHSSRVASSVWTLSRSCGDARVGGQKMRAGVDTKRAQRRVASPRGEDAMHVDDLIIVSIDDHLIEPPDMFDDHVPAGTGARPPS